MNEQMNEAQIYSNMKYGKQAAKTTLFLTVGKTIYPLRTAFQRTQALEISGWICFIFFSMSLRNFSLSIMVCSAHFTGTAF